MNARILKIVRPEEIGSTRRTAVDRETLIAAAAIVDDIDARGDVAVLEHAKRLGDLREGEPVLLDKAMMAEALGRLPRETRELLERTAARIERFARAQRESIKLLAMSIPGGEAGHDCVPVVSAGCYAPAGRYPLPSSVLMTAVTARVAGVEKVCVISPRPTDITLAAASIAKADMFLAIGGVQGVVAAARGLCGVSRCDLIVGPGNRWVTAAKQLISADTGIDMLAGPSELVVIADDSADPRVVAADLIAQAEHDDDAVPILITTRGALLEAVDQELAHQLETLPTRATAAKSLRGGFAILTTSTAEAAGLSDRIGPEHLEIITRDATSLARTIRCAGAVFIGGGAAEVMGDYGTGPNHVLPTGGTARFRAGLSVMTFLRLRTWIRVDRPEEARELARDAAAFARLESLEGHARSAEMRCADRGTG